jgi:hypothetical protein
MRLNPNKGEYNLYCYCYRRDWLDDHIRQARRGIRFVNTNFSVEFTIPDGAKIHVVFPDGQQYDWMCRYIDDYHVEIDNTIYYILEFAERIKRENIFICQAE